ncbi:MAG: hypothetical protein KAW17_07875 [Candidatus Eisenbacteria sp.]|nr:hypothetical protein [Candidatus Eisenbacteria bacterium]
MRNSTMVEVRIKCPRCGESLMDEDRQIDGHPSICAEGYFEGNRGRIWMSSLYGSYNVESELDVPEGDVTEFSCPKCGESLNSTRSCELCKAPMVPFGFAEGGVVQICSRKGCRRHLVEFSDIRAELRSFLDSYSAFF